MTEEPTPEQIEAGRKAVLANFHPPTDLNPTWHLNPEEVARAVLVAAADAAPQEPSGDRVMQIAAHLAQMHTFTLSDGEAIARAALKLAAPVQVDEAKLAELIGTIHFSDYEDDQKLVSRRVARVVAEWLQAGGR